MDALLYTLNALSADSMRLCAIDGPAGAGKSALAKMLENALPSACIIPMDDFFLPPKLRTPARLASPGGNIDHERMLEEVLLPLKEGGISSYRAYDCRTDSFFEVAVPKRRLYLIEGVYSMHPALSPLYDYRVFLDCDSALQHERLMRRGDLIYKRFCGEWLPLEKQYSETFDVKRLADRVLHADKLIGLFE